MKILKIIEYKNFLQKGFSSNFVFILWCICGCFMTHILLANYLTALIKPSYDKPIETALGKPSKKRSFNKEIVLKGGRGSIWQYLLVENKNILVRREGVRAKMSFFTQFLVVSWKVFKGNHPLSFFWRLPLDIVENGLIPFYIPGGYIYQV